MNKAGKFMATRQVSRVLPMRFMLFEYLRLRQKGAVRHIEEANQVVLFWNKGNIHAVSSREINSKQALYGLENLRDRMSHQLKQEIIVVKNTSELAEIKRKYTQSIVRSFKSDVGVKAEVIGQRNHVDAIIEKYDRSTKSAGVRPKVLRNIPQNNLTPFQKVGSTPSSELTAKSQMKRNAASRPKTTERNYRTRDLIKEENTRSELTLKSLQIQNESSRPKPTERHHQARASISDAKTNEKPFQRQTEAAHFVYYFNNGTELTFHVGDITEQRVDAIVNAANDELRHNGGVAKAIATAAGYCLLEESAEQRRVHGGRIPISHVVTTGAGRLPCKYVLHAIGPHVKMPDYRKLLERTVKNIVKECSEQGIRSVAIPAISTGIYGVPKHEGAQAMKRALIKKMEGRRNTLRDIRIVDIGHETISAYRKVFEEDVASENTATREEVNWGTSVAAASHDWDEKGAAGRDLPPVTYSTQDYGNKYHQNFHERGRPLEPAYEGGATYHTSDVRSFRERDGEERGVIFPQRDYDDDEDLETSIQVAHDTSTAYGHEEDATSLEDHDDEDVCPICMDTFTDRTDLRRCGHSFCKDCLTRALKIQNKCPICGDLLGEQRGNQPKGTMDVSHERESLPGYEGYRTIIIDYTFPSGTQKEEHPNPGSPYKGTKRRAFLPDNSEGREVLNLLERAFKAKLLFTIGRSVTTGQEGVVVWNDVHQKTSRSGGVVKYGYPDPTYFSRVKEELAAKGIK